MLSRSLDACPNLAAPNPNHAGLAFLLSIHRVQTADGANNIWIFTTIYLDSVAGDHSAEIGSARRLSPKGSASDPS